MTIRSGFKAAAFAAGVIVGAACGVTAPTQGCPVNCVSPLVCDPVRQTCVASMQAMGSGGGTATSSGGGSAFAEGLPCEVETLLTASCTSCHGPVLKNGANVRLLTRADLLAPSATDPATSVAQRCSTRMHQMVAAMPPAPDAPVVNSELSAFDAWLSAGAPAGTCTPVAGGGGAGGASGGGSATAGGGAGGGGTAGGTTSAGGAGGGTTGNAYCRPCTASSQCGASTNFCLGSASTGGCGTDCSAGQACPTGASCVTVRNSAGAMVGSNCFPSSGVCSGGIGGGSAGGGSAGGGGAGGGTGGGAANACASNPDTFANYAGAFFAAKCASCHHHSGEFTTPASITSNCRSRIASGNMPKLPTFLTAAERTRVLAWIDCGKRP